MANNNNSRSSGGGFADVLMRVIARLRKMDDEEVNKKPVLGYRGRQLIVLLGVFGFSAFVGYNLLKYTVLDGDKWRQLANDQQTGQLTIMANRGTIYDANGTVLAQSSTVWNVIIAPVAISRAEETRYKAYAEKKTEWLLDEDVNKAPMEAYVPLSDIIADGLSKILGVKKDGMLKSCEALETNYYIVKRSVEKPEVTQIQQFLLENGILSDCVYTEQSSKRYYPNDSLASNVIGFTNFDGNGVYGLEAYYDDYLRGTDGKAFYTQDGLGQGVQYANDNYFSAVDGYSLVLTLDEVLQHYLEKNLEQCVSQNAVINRACGIIMDCNTGGVLAMATSPSYDLNNPSKLMSEFDLKELEDMNNHLVGKKPKDDDDDEETSDGKKKTYTEEEIDAREAVMREQQWKNKAVTELYYPGSVFKTVTCAAGLDREVINLSSEFTCLGYLDVAGTKIDCHEHSGHGTLPLQLAITNSCNPAFMQIGALLGTENFFDYFEAFGFTEPTGIDLPGEAQSLYIPRNRMGPVELATSAFGQTNKITPIQMATAFCAVVNGGNLVTPHVVDKIVDSSGNVIESKGTEIKRQVISEDTSVQMRNILENIVSYNGGVNAYIEGYRIGGKSGTAERIDEYNAAGGLAGGAAMTYVSTFAASVPMDDPQIVMLVLADTPTAGAYYGSTVCAPIVSAVFREGLEHLGIYPTLTAEQQAKMDATVPYVIGSYAMKAESMLAANGFNVRIVGDTEGDAVVTSQIPSSGMNIPRGSTVVLYFGEEEPEIGTVPNVIGMSVDRANETLANAGFNIKISGGAANNADAVATEQNFFEGYTMYKGNVVEVTFSVSIQDG